MTMAAVAMKHFYVMLIISSFSLNYETVVGRVVPQDSQLLLKTSGNNVEVYRDAGNGSSWLQMVLVFARDSPNSQSTSLIDGNESEKTTECKNGFIQLESKKCYFFSTQHLTWSNAMKSCQSMVTTLAYPLNAIENTAIVNYLNANYTGTQGWWLGGTDAAKDGEWVWDHSKSPIVYTDWLKNQPTNGQDEHCLHYWKDGQWKWNDVNCNSKYPFICQE